MEGIGLKASALAVDITPPVGFPLGGYILRQGVSTGVLDPIKVRIGCIADDESKVIIAGFDWIYIMGGWGKTLRDDIGVALKINSRNVILTATHTHSGPGIFGSSHATNNVDDFSEEEYLAGVSKRILEAVVELNSSLQYVKLKKGKEKVTPFGSLGANRNNPNGAVDENIVNLQFVDDNDEMVLQLINYSCHPTSLGPENLLFSGDFVGYGLNLLDSKYGGTSIFLNGSAGDVSTRFTRQERSVAETARFGNIFTEAIHWAMMTSVPHSGDTLNVISNMVPVAYVQIPGDAESEKIIVKIEDKLKKAEENSKNALSIGEIRRLESIKEGALARLFISKLGGLESIFGKRKMEAEVQLLKIGEMGILFLPGEVMTKTAIKLKASAEIPLMVAGYANDYFGYLVEGAEGGSEEYESLVAFLTTDSITKIVNRAINMIGGVNL